MTQMSQIYKRAQSLCGDYKMISQINTLRNL